MFRRARPPADPVTIYLDGDAVVAERGEPLAIALLGAGVRALARSPKLHRPRGPSCLRGACDGCLARVDGVPNVTACLVPAAGGERIEAQNVIGSRESDLLRVTDWFFPRGIDHHHLMAGVPAGVSEIVTGFARKLAGLGKLPTAAEAPHAAVRVETDVLVVGAGIAGLATATACAKAGLGVLCVDDGVAPGGAALGVPELLAPHVESAAAANVSPRVRTTALGVYSVADGAREVLVADAGGARVVRARAVVVAAGAHDGTIAVPNADLPGVLSARALCRLAAGGVVPDGLVAIVGEGFWADAAERALGAGSSIRVRVRDVVAIKGRGRASSIETKSGGRSRNVDVAVVALAIECAPAFEMSANLGAELDVHSSAGWTPRRDAEGKMADAAWATGECAGLPFDPEALVTDGRNVADSVRRALLG